MLIDSRLTQLVEDAVSAMPGLSYSTKRSSRALEAAVLVTKGEVRPADQHGWEVSGHLCDGLRCDCEDRKAPINANGRKFCKHNLAVIFTQRLEKSQELINWLAAQMFSGDRVVRMVFEFDYANERSKTLVGTFGMGRVQRMAPADYLRVTYEELRYATALLGLSLKGMPRKISGNGGWLYVWELSLDGSEPLTHEKWLHRGSTEQMVENRRNEKLLGWFGKEMTAKQGDKVTG